MSTRAAIAPSDALALSSGVAAANGSVALNLVLTSPAGNEPASLQWTLAFPAGNVASISVTAGAGLNSASKSLNCFPGPGTYTCLVSGMNSGIISNGTVAVVNLTVTAGSTTISIAISNSFAASPSGLNIPLSLTGGTVTGSALPAVNSLSCSPTSVSSSSSSACTVTLNSAAPAGGATVTLSSTNSTLNVPPSVTVAASLTTAFFSVTTSGIARDQIATVTATYNGASANDTIALVPPTLVSSLVCNPATLSPSTSSTCTVTLTKNAPAGGVSVVLSTVNSQLSAPSAVTIAAGANFVTFTLQAGSFTSGQSGSLTASYNGSAQSATITLSNAVLVTALDCSPSGVMSGATSSCTAELSQAVLSNTILSVSSTSNALAVPASVTVPAGSSTTAFNVSVGSIDAHATASIGVALGGSSQAATLTLWPAPAVSALTCVSATLAAGSSTRCTAAMSNAAGNIVVSLASDNPALRVPATVTVHQGALRASFTATSLPSASGGIVVTASFHGTSSTTTLTMTAPSTGAPKLTALSCTPKTLRPGTSGICRVSLHAAPGGAGAEVRLSTSNASLQVPATVRTRPGQSTLDFQVDAIGSGEGIVVQASLGPDMVQETLSVAWDRSEPIRVPGPQFAKSGAELRFQVSAQDPAATLSAGALPAGAYFDSNAREFRWTPAGTQIGAYSLNFMVIDSAGRETTARVSVQVESGDPVVTRIVNAASRSRDAACSPGAIAAIEGRWLTDGTTVSDAETKVWANGAVVPILAASDTELNILCPDAIAGGEVQFVVQTGHGLSDPLTTTARSAAPGIFSLDGSGNGQGWVLLKDTAGLAMVRNRRLEGQPAIPGDQVLLYATGIDRLANISVQIAEFQVTPAAIDAVPRHPGLFQVAVAVPDVGADNGEVPVSLFGDAPDGSSLHCNVVRMAVEGGIR